MVQTSLPALLFWLSVSLIAMPLVVYPVVLFLLASLRRKERYPDPEDLPSISVLMAARNEEANIAGTIENLLSLDYPSELVEIRVASDASTDSTDEIVRGFGLRNVFLYRSDRRMGKSALVTELAKQATGDVLVFTDADTTFLPGTLRELVRPMQDPGVGCVDGCRRNSLSTETCESVYWRYEQWMKTNASRFGAVLGATGAVFAVRKELFRPLSPERADDFETAVMTRVQGYRCVYNPEALAVEPAPDDSAQFRRMVRIVSWMSGSAWLLLGRALRRGRLFLAAQLLVHKILRWQAGLLTIAATALLVPLAGDPLYALLLASFAAFHLLALLALKTRGRMPGVLKIPYYYWLMNAASMIGTLKFILAAASPRWDERTSGNRAGSREDRFDSTLPGE